jgi:hypothetical protein
MFSIANKIDDSANRVVHRALGYFVTRHVERLPDGRQRISHSRRHRKGLPPVELASDGTVLQVAPVTSPWLRVWAPRRLSWWIAVFFIIGSACFAAGGFASLWPQYLPPAVTAGSVINTVFFVGSIFFTTAAGLQVLEAINGDVADLGTSDDPAHRGWRWFAWKPHNAGYSASLVQFLGTLLFNLNTADAMLSKLTWLEGDLLVWVPDVIGSVCFLVSSYLALIEVSHRFWSVQPAQPAWWIVVINLLGSVAFMISAVFSFVPAAGPLADWPWAANLSTLIGAACFLVASYLMVPELFGAGKSVDTPTASIGPEAA